ncbi:hypothetical protein IMCC3317_41700 [Kordia antarctica]|uniref:Peptidase M1 membrane alanine aminopeptidase domain-containing protein n=1 Tax=Kordia antarctica TaxID=1218801 RepID=A0A7L4ZQI3_9FLAO|nr:hypothetical protein [Kordia antarctica]QHI38770.1 hypothetical protein IMCC3317_41700 [Kordia antarctica]
MKKILLVLILFISYTQLLTSQNNLTEKQQYFLQELNDAYGGQILFAKNYHKTSNVYYKLVEYSGMNFPVVFNQTFHWGEAHYGGLIILDYSTIHKKKDILAFVFAHEWAHQALGHQPNLYKPNGSKWRVKTSSTQYEDEADYYAGQFLAKYEYDIKKVTNYLSSLPEFNDTQHSSGKKRAATVLRGFNSVPKINRQITQTTISESTPEFQSILIEEFNNNTKNWKTGRDFKKMTGAFDGKVKTLNVHYEISNGKYKIRNLGDYGQGGIAKDKLKFNSSSNFEISTVFNLYSGGFEVSWDSCSSEPDAEGYTEGFSNYIYLTADGNYRIGHHNRKVEFGNTERSGTFTFGNSNRVYLRIVYKNGTCKYYINNKMIASKSANICGNGASFKVDTKTDVEIDNILILRKN